ncbi:unnamed protein product [Closterium sp. NIES-64]|nr:unnamed protein product [Closterium sp. NIES-64]
MVERHETGLDCKFHLLYWQQNAAAQSRADLNYLPQHTGRIQDVFLVWVGDEASEDTAYVLVSGIPGPSYLQLFPPHSPPSLQLFRFAPDWESIAPTVYSVNSCQPGTNLHLPSLARQKAYLWPAEMEWWIVAEEEMAAAPFLLLLGTLWVTPLFQQPIPCASPPFPTSTPTPLQLFRFRTEWESTAPTVYSVNSCQPGTNIDLPSLARQKAYLWPAEMEWWIVAEGRMAAAHRDPVGDASLPPRFPAPKYGAEFASDGVVYGGAYVSELR